MRQASFGVTLFIKSKIISARKDMRRRGCLAVNKGGILLTIKTDLKPTPFSPM
jgi:hypothetical protein